MEPKSEPKQIEEKKAWTPPVVEDFDLLSTTGSGGTGLVNDNLAYS
jgi:hypothetical protein